MKNQAVMELIKFSVVGFLNTIVDFGIFTLLVTGGVTIIWAQVCSYSCGMINSFLLNRSWTFREAKRDEFTEPLRYIAANLATLGILTMVIMFLTNYLHLPVLLSKIAGTIIGVVLNFLSSKFWVFQGVDEKGYE